MTKSEPIRPIGIYDPLTMTQLEPPGNFSKRSGIFDLKSAGGR